MLMDKSFHNKIIQGDCCSVMKEIPDESVNLVFADPPFNIGVKYDNYNDIKSFDEYMDWTEEWIDHVLRILKSDGSLYIAIGDEYAADIRVLMRIKDITFRNWIIWYYTFGQHMRKKFSRSHTHVLYFLKDEKHFTFNADEIRIPSARQLLYNDKRANPKGKIPDDVWNYSRVCGTFKERQGNHPCQMPENLLERIILASSNPGDVVLDPFAGSGTTLAVAKKCGRIFTGIEISKEYVNTIMERLYGTEQNYQFDLFNSISENDPAHSAAEVDPESVKELNKQKISEKQ